WRRSVTSGAFSSPSTISGVSRPNSFRREHCCDRAQSATWSGSRASVGTSSTGAPTGSTCFSSTTTKRPPCRFSRR
ncbi:MAG: Glucose-fructose oxidoreductase, partial [uncultured Thermomicrobiales bacterium]